MDVFDFLALQSFLTPITSECTPSLFSELHLACLLKDANCSFLFSNHQVIHLDLLNSPLPSHHLEPSNNARSNLRSEFPLEIYISEHSSSNSQALFFQIQNRLYFVIHTLIGNIHLSKANALDKGLLFEWPCIQMKIVPNRSPNVSILNPPDSNALAFKSLSSVLDRMEHKLTVDLLRHPVLDSSLLNSAASNASLSEYFTRMIEFTRHCQHALDSPLTADAIRSLVLTGEYGPSAAATCPHEPTLFQNISSSYLSTFLAEDNMRRNREKSSEALSQLSSQLQRTLDGIVSTKPPAVKEGDQVNGSYLATLILK